MARALVCRGTYTSDTVPCTRTDFTCLMGIGYPDFALNSFNYINHVVGATLQLKTGVPEAIIMFQSRVLIWISS